MFTLQVDTIYLSPRYGSLVILGLSLIGHIPLVVLTLYNIPNSPCFYTTITKAENFGFENKLH